jgi:DNA-binding transcriptional LysR family regulator
MSLEGVEVFVEVVEAGSFVAAARRLGMPITTVSAKIARLEERLQATLIQRTTRKMRVTEAGRRYYERCIVALAAMQEGERELAEAAEEPSGPIRITCPANIAQSLLTPVVEQFLTRYPKCSVEIIATNRRVDMIAEGIDLAVRVGPLADSSLISRKFRSNRVCLWASPSYLERRGEPATVVDLRNHELIWFTRLPARMTLKSAYEAVTIDFQGRFAADDHDLVKAFILRGNGIGLLPEFIEEDASARPFLRQVLPEFFSEVMTAFFIYPAQKHPPLTVRAFVALATTESN